VALWLRQSRASTADMTRGLLEAMAAEGIVLGDRSDPSAFVSVLRGLLHECVDEQREHEGRAAIGRGEWRAIASLSISATACAPVSLVLQQRDCASVAA
jgi:hypothetical protein